MLQVVTDVPASVITGICVGVPFSASVFGSCPLDLSDLRDPTGSNATANLAVRVTGTSKLLHHSKVEIPLEGHGIVVQ